MKLDRRILFEGEHGIHSTVWTARDRRADWSERYRNLRTSVSWNGRPAYPNTKIKRRTERE